MKANFNSPKIDEQKLSEFMLKAMQDITSTLSAMLIIIGDRLHLYRTMVEIGTTNYIRRVSKSN